MTGAFYGPLGELTVPENQRNFATKENLPTYPEKIRKLKAEGAIGIARTANKVRKTPLRVILNGLGKDAAYIISRINGFTYVQTPSHESHTPE